MITPEQVPETVLLSGMEAIYKAGENLSYPALASAIAAALSAWPGMECRPTFGPSRIILPLPQEASDAKR